MKKRFVLLFLLISSLCFTQVASDIHDYFYKDLERWETLGLVKNLPHAKPYPLQVVKSILTTIMEKGDNVQIEIAKNHYGRIFEKKFLFGLKTEFVTDFTDDENQISASPSFDFNYEIYDNLTASASLNVWAINKLPNEEILPYAQHSSKDIKRDNARVGKFFVLPAINSSLAYGTKDVYLNLGVMRSSFGPIYDGLIANPSAMMSPQIDFYFNQNIWAFNFSMSNLSASNINSPNSFYPEKFLVLHSLEYRPFDLLKLSVFESVVYGERFEPSYLIPFSTFFLTQGLFGFSDNSWLGVMASYNPLANLKFDFVFYADDLHFNDMMKFKFDTKWRTAQQLAISWAPQKSCFLNLINLNYTQVMPYTYSHLVDTANKENFTSVNYQNYSHFGRNYGIGIEPNSDKIDLKIGLTPLEKFDVDIFGSYIRHGNPNENIDKKFIKEYIKPANNNNEYLTDGSINNNTWTRIGHTAQDHTPFLTQKHLRHNIQTGFDVNCRLPILKTGGLMVFKVGYIFELDINPGVSKPIYYTNRDVGDIDLEIEKQYKKWLDNLGGKNINNYLSFGFQLFF